MLELCNESVKADLKNMTVQAMCVKQGLLEGKTCDQIASDGIGSIYEVEFIKEQLHIAGYI